MSEMLSLVLRNPPIIVIPTIGIFAAFALLRLKSNYVNHGVISFTRTSGHASDSVAVSEPAAQGQSEKDLTEQGLPKVDDVSDQTAPVEQNRREEPARQGEKPTAVEPQSKPRERVRDMPERVAYSYFQKSEPSFYRLHDAVDETWDLLARWSRDVAISSQRENFENRSYFDERQLWSLIKVRDAWRDVREAAPETWGRNDLDDLQHHMSEILNRLTDDTIRAQREDSGSIDNVRFGLSEMQYLLKEYSSNLEFRKVGKEFLTEVSRARD
ncbi:hypothetical protein CI15_06305 [Paraburkholderia monticola]|uniref:Uncharacterized protein n=1 Tax=Paraburkholderia monticola TaxID=1399968 RepID=A0A149PXX1_9BURK|nr:hypothetical protein [Paraburkholderia monticola]KXU89796.1 hypothetical protein CI15_06305 [Paraburkholderia monticola]